MKVSSFSDVGSAAAPRGGARPAAGGFSLGPMSGPGSAAPAGVASAAAAVGSLDALLALQEVSGPLERRRKAVKRAGRILDVLDEIKLSLLDGGLPAATLSRLVAAVREEKGGADEPGLVSLLNEIETRAAVELAKLEMGRAAA